MGCKPQEAISPSHFGKLLLGTCDAAQKPEARSRVPLPPTSCRLPHAGRHGDGHGDGLVELPPSWLHRDDGAEGGAVTNYSLSQLLRDWLSLGREGKVSDHLQGVLLTSVIFESHITLALLHTHTHTREKHMYTHHIHTNTGKTHRQGVLPAGPLGSSS